MKTISVHTIVFGMFCIHVPRWNYFDNQLLSWLRNSATPPCLDYRRAISWYLQLISRLIIFDPVLSRNGASTTVWTDFQVFYHHLRTSSRALASGVGATNMFEQICRVVSGDKLVHCTERSSFAFHLPFFWWASRSRAQACGSVMATERHRFWKPPSTLSTLQREPSTFIHLSDSFWKASFSVSDFSVLVWTEGLNG